MECLSQISHSMRREFIKVGQFLKLFCDMWSENMTFVVTEEKIKLNFIDNTESMWGEKLVSYSIPDFLLIHKSAT